MGGSGGDARRVVSLGVATLALLKYTAVRIRIVTCFVVILFYFLNAVAAACQW